MEEYKNILVRMPNWLGDAVMATPILTDLKNRFPQSTLTAMCQGSVGSLFKEDPRVDEVISFKRPNGWIHRKEHLEIIEPIRQGSYDLGILLTNSLSSAWWFWRGKVKRRIGFNAFPRSLLLTDGIDFPKNKENQHLVQTYKELLRPLGIAPSSSMPKLYCSNEEMQSAKALLNTLGIDINKHIVVGINPGAAYGSAKCYPPERFIEVSLKLLENPDVKIVYFGDKTGSPLVESICNKLPESVVNLSGKTDIRQLMALIAHLKVLLTNDSGPMHIAAALGTPVVALFGSTNPVKTGPMPSGDVIFKKVECSPCYKRTCPIDFRCMKRIEPDEVIEKLKKWFEHE